MKADGDLLNAEGTGSYAILMLSMMKNSKKNVKRVLRNVPQCAKASSVATQCCE